MSRMTDRPIATSKKQESPIDTCNIFLRNRKHNRYLYQDKNLQDIFCTIIIAGHRTKSALCLKFKKKMFSIAKN